MSDPKTWHLSYWETWNDQSQEWDSQQNFLIKIYRDGASSRIMISVHAQDSTQIILSLSYPTLLQDTGNNDDSIWTLQSDSGKVATRTKGTFNFQFKDVHDCRRFQTHLNKMREALFDPSGIQIFRIATEDDRLRDKISTMVQGPGWRMFTEQVGQSLKKIESASTKGIAGNEFDAKVKKVLQDQRELIDKVKDVLKTTPPYGTN